MRSLVLETAGRLRLVEKPRPVPNPGETVLRVSHCSVCRTDAKAWSKGHRDLALPRVLGHEIAGIEEETGDRFVVWPGRACGVCPACAGGHENRCPRMSIVGFHRDGGFADCLTVPKSSLIPIPPSLPGHLACLAEPLACTLNALESACASPGQSVLILGAGAVGLMMAMAVRAMGGISFIEEENPQKFAKSEQFRKAVGISTFVGSNAPEMDIVVNAAPSFDTFIEGLRRLRSGGCFCHFSAFVDDSAAPIPHLNEIHYRELRMAGAYGCTGRQTADALRLLDGFREQAGLLIEEIIRLERVPSVLPAVLTGQPLKFVVDLLN